MLAAAVPRPLAAGGAATGRLADGAAVTLVGPGRTDAQIAAQLYISVRTVSSPLDQIRDKIGC
jgi:DNA-binding CsgD family transcriptional regulator